MEPIYVILVINLIVWTGIFGYTFHVNNKIDALNKKVSKLENK